MQIVSVHKQINIAGKNILTPIYIQTLCSPHGAYYLKWPVSCSIHYSTVAEWNIKGDQCLVSCSVNVILSVVACVCDHEFETDHCSACF